MKPLTLIAALFLAVHFWTLSHPTETEAQYQRTLDAIRGLNCAQKIGCTI